MARLEDAKTFAQKEVDFIEKLARKDPKLLPNKNAGTRRTTNILPRDGGAKFSFSTLPRIGDTTVHRIGGGVLIQSETNQGEVVEISADSAILWLKDGAKPKEAGGKAAPSVQQSEDADRLLGAVFEGSVIVRQKGPSRDARSGEKDIRGSRVYYDFRVTRPVVLKD